MLSRPSPSASPPSNPARTPPMADAKNHKPNFVQHIFLEHIVKKLKVQLEIKLTHPMFEEGK